MHNFKCCGRLLTILTLSVLLFIGCSSLPKETVQHTPRSSQASSLMELGHKYYRSGQYAQACTAYENALANHASVDDGAGVSTALASLARAQMALGMLNTAEENFRRAHQAARGLNQPELEARALGGLGAVQLHRQQPQEAITLLETALKQPLDDPGKTRATLLHDLGSAHQKLGDNAAAASYFQQALTMHEPLRDLTGIATDCYSLALLYEAEGDYVLALENAHRALSNDKRAENSPGVAQDLTLLGSLSYASGDEEQAVDYYRRAKLTWQALRRTDKIEDLTQRLQRIESP